MYMAWQLGNGGEDNPCICGPDAHSQSFTRVSTLLLLRRSVELLRVIMVDYRVLMKLELLHELGRYMHSKDGRARRTARTSC